MNAPAPRRTHPLCASRHVGHAVVGPWCADCARDPEQLLGVVRGALATLRARGGDVAETAALLDGLAGAVQSVAGLRQAERVVADHTRGAELDLARDAWRRGYALVLADAERERDAAMQTHDGPVASVRGERVLALEGLATRARRLWHILAPQGEFAGVA